MMANKDPILPCAASLGAPAGTPRGWLDRPLPGIDDEEGACVPDGLGPVVDAHVHLFPDRLFQALWAWFDRHGWPVRYRLNDRAVLAHLFEHGVHRAVALTYAHKPGMARDLNRYMADLAREEPRIIALGTVFPGEDGADDIVREAFALGLRGLKLHCHVQCVAADDPRLEPVYRRAEDAGLPVVIHAGREPRSSAYRCDPYVICSADRVARVLEAFPRLKLVVPHLGADEYAAYERLLDRHDNLWLDTTMAIAGYLPGPQGTPLVRARPDRVLYGTDFPNIPYAWDRELKILQGLELGREQIERVLWKNAAEVFDLTKDPELHEGSLG